LTGSTFTPGNTTRCYSTCFSQSHGVFLHVLSDFAFRYIFLPSSCKLMDAFIISSLPLLGLKDLSNNRAPLLLRHYSDSSLLRTHPPPSYHRPTSQRLLVIGPIFSGNFLPGQVGLLQSLSMSLLPCCRYHPAGIRQPYIGQFSIAYTAFTSKLQARLPEFYSITRPPVRLLALRPGNLLITP